MCFKVDAGYGQHLREPSELENDATRQRQNPAGGQDSALPPFAHAIRRTGSSTARDQVAETTCQARSNQDEDEDSGARTVHACPKRCPRSLPPLRRPLRRQERRRPIDRFALLQLRGRREGFARV